MVEIRVALTDAAGAPGLLRRLAALCDRSSVSFDRMRNEIRVRDGVKSATLSVGDHAYAMANPIVARAAVSAGHAA